MSARFIGIILLSAFCIGIPCSLYSQVPGSQYQFIITYTNVDQDNGYVILSYYLNNVSASPITIGNFNVPLIIGNTSDTIIEVKTESRSTYPEKKKILNLKIEDIKSVPLCTLSVVGTNIDRDYSELLPGNTIYLGYSLIQLVGRPPYPRYVTVSADGNGIVMIDGKNSWNTGSFLFRCFLIFQYDSPSRDR